MGGLGATSAVLMINSLDMYTTRETVMRVMAAFGPPVKDVRLAMERGSTRLNRGFGFVEFHSVDVRHRCVCLVSACFCLRLSASAFGRCACCVVGWCLAPVDCIDPRPSS